MLWEDVLHPVYSDVAPKYENWPNSTILLISTKSTDSRGVEAEAKETETMAVVLVGTVGEGGAL